MSFWIDKYRPRTLDDANYHERINLQLKRLARKEEVPHLLFYGPSGSGKRTRLEAFLRLLYGDTVDKTQLTRKSFETGSGKKIETKLICSMHHVEFSPSDVGFYDRVVVQSLIKDIAQTRQIVEAPRPFKVVVINEAHDLSRDAQHGLRRTMEKYVSNLRIFFLCNSLEKIIDPLQSRCVLVRVPLPPYSTIAQTLETIASLEGVSLSRDQSTRISEYSGGNMRRALLSLEATVRSANPLEIERTDWEEFIEQIASAIVKEQTPSCLLVVRTKFYELLSHCVPATVVIKTLCHELLRLVDYPLKLELIHEAARYEQRMNGGIKAIFHLEAFVAKFMAMYKKYLLDLDMGF